MYMFAVCMCEGQRSSLVFSLIIIQLIPPNLNIYLFTLCARTQTFHSCLFWRSEDKFWESILYFYHVSSKDRAQVVKQRPLPSKPSHWPSLHLIFWDILSLNLKLTDLPWLAGQPVIMSFRGPPVCPPTPQPWHAEVTLWATVSSFYVDAGD